MIQRSAYQSRSSVSESPGVLLKCRLLSPCLELLNLEYLGETLGSVLLETLPWFESTVQRILNFEL